MRTLRVKKIKLSDYSHVMIHTFPLPEVGDHSFYRTITSYGAFFESLKKRNWSDEYLYLVIDDRQGAPSHPYEEERDKSLPIAGHKSLYAFFEAIGYDRKKKKII